MKRPRLAKWLRISASAGCLILSGLLIALWVRSYSWNDNFARSHGNQRVTNFGSQNGSAYFVHYNYSSHIVPIRPTAGWERYRAKASKTAGSFQVVNSSGIILWQLPYWFLMLFIAIPGVVAILPWIRFRFSLRTLFLVTTAVAVGLAMVMYFQPKI
jgi:hypothetical protein